jgi:hypothetical protein
MEHGYTSAPLGMLMGRATAHPIASPIYFRGSLSLAKEASSPSGKILARIDMSVDDDFSVLRDVT